MLRRRPRSGLVLVLVLLAPALAGCASEPAAPAVAEDEPVVVTAPTDYGYLDDEGVADAPHLHDYWDGKETLVVMQETKKDSTFFVSDEWATVFRPEAGRVVPQGASEVEVTFSWRGSPTDQYAAPELWVKTAADNEAWKVGPVEQGVPLVVASANARNDLPHQGLSAWEFQLRLHPGAAGLIWFDGEVDVLVRAHRGLVIPLYPAHPDLWMGRGEIALLAAEEDFFVYEGDSNGGYNCYGGCPLVHVPDDGAVVPPETAAIEVTLTMGDDSLTTLGLSVHGAESREFARLPPTSEEGKTRVWRIPVERGMADGPYAKQSQWAFLPYIDGPVPDGWHAGSYRIEARALRAA